MNPELFENLIGGIDKNTSSRIRESRISTATLSLEDRAELYSKAYPKFPPLRIWNGRIEDLWFLGQNYQSRSTYYGSYPGNYLKRIEILFPDPSPFYKNQEHNQ